jgi:hypothetical protein
MSDIDRLANQLILNKDSSSALLLNKEMIRRGLLDDSNGYPIFIEDLLETITIYKFGRLIYNNNSVDTDFLVEDEQPKYQNSCVFCIFIYDPKNMDGLSSRIDRQLQNNGIPHNGSKTLYNNGFLLKFKQINSQHIPIIKDTVKDIKSKVFYLLHDFNYFISKPIDFENITYRSRVQVENGFKIFLKADIIKNPYNPELFSILSRVKKREENKHEIFIGEGERIMTIFP